MTIRSAARPLVRNLLEHEQISIFYGDAGCGKSFAAIDLGLHIAAGRDWLGHRVAQGPVVYVAAEAGIGIINRVVAWRQTYGLTDLPFAAIVSPVDFCHPAAGDVGRVIAAIRDEEIDPVLVVIDTVSRVLSGGNENAPDDMGALVRSLDRLRDQLRCHVLAIHHCGKEIGRGSRGHSLLRCAVDTEIEITRSEGSGVSTAIVAKQRDGALGQHIAFKLRQVVLGADDDGEPVTSCVVEAVNDTTPKRPPPKLRPAEQIAFDTLQKALAAEGTAAPPHNTSRPGRP
jgi:hypothetical protein